MLLEKLFNERMAHSLVRVAIIGLLVVCCVCYLTDHLVSQFLAPLIYVLLGITFLKIYFRRSKPDKTAPMFLIIFVVYSLYAVCFYYFYQRGNLREMMYVIHQEIWDDQVRNFLIADYLSDFSFKEIVSFSFKFDAYREFPLFVMILGFLGKVVASIDSCNYLAVLLHVSLVSALIPVFLYKISRFYFSGQLAYKISMIYAIFSFPLFFAARLLRDQHIALLYIIAIYLICNPQKDKWKFMQISLLTVVCYYFRVEHGYFMVLLIGLYVQAWFKNFFNDTKLMFLAMAVLTAVLFLFFEPKQTGVAEVIDIAERSYTGYEERSLTHAGKDSFGKDLMKLPVPLNYVATATFGQIQPFPFWVRLGLKTTRTSWIWFPLAVAGVYWFFVWGTIIRGLFTGLLTHEKIPPELLHLAGATILLIFLTTAEINTRRMFCMYPPLFLLAVFSYLRMGLVERKGLVSLLTIVLVTLHIAYSLMKLMQGGSPI